MNATSGLKQINLFLFLENKEKTIEEKDLKFLIDKSIFETFGLIESNKIKYFIKMEANNKFILKSYLKNINKLSTAISMINNLELKMRIKTEFV